MSILWKLVFFNRASSTHHKLALDSLRFLRGPNAEQWANLFLADHEQFLTGSKAPDNEFKDFKNHVLHVADGFWGGATVSARKWYQQTVLALSQGDWPAAVYNAGVLSHYFTDPFQPFHTGQTEAEGKVHRAAEWSICKAYDELQAIIDQDLQGYPEYELPTQADWLEEAIRQGAITAHESYDASIDHYDLNRGIKDPPSGLDQELKDRLARLIGLAVIGFARVLERAFEESAATPPDVAVSLHTLLAGMKVPLNWIRKKFTDVHERAVIESIYLEIQEKGKVIDALPEDERLVRKLYAQEVLKVPVRQLDAEPARAAGTQYGTGAPSRSAAATPVTSPVFQRTVMSPSPSFEIPRGPAAPLESCLMVPLAKTPPPDFVADSVLKAYLHQENESPVPKTPSGNTIAMPPVAPAAPVAQTARPAAATPSIARELLPTKSELDKAERRLQRRLSRSVDPEPQLIPPAMPVTTSTTAPNLDLDLPADMFAPLPPPRATNQPVTSAPIASPPPVASPAKPVVAATLPTRAPVATPNPSAVIPAPHIKLPERTVERKSESQSPSAVEPRTPSQVSAVRTSPSTAPAPAAAPVRNVTPVQTAEPVVDKTEPTADSQASRRFYLEPSAAVVDAPSIGPKTAERLHSINIATVGQLLSANAEQAAVQLGNPAATAVIRDWQDQARLVCTVPNLRGHDAQFLVACQIRTANQLRGSQPQQLLQQVSDYLTTTAGQRLLRGGAPPDLAEVTEWIVAARDARCL